MVPYSLSWYKADSACVEQGSALSSAILFRCACPRSDHAEIRFGEERRQSTGDRDRRVNSGRYVKRQRAGEGKRDYRAPRSLSKEDIGHAAIQQTL